MCWLWFVHAFPQDGLLSLVDAGAEEEEDESAGERVLIARRVSHRPCRTGGGGGGGGRMPITAICYGAS